MAHLQKQAASSTDVPTSSINVDEECLPFRPGSLDLVLSSLSLHWVNDLPGVLRQVRDCLRNDGCFLGVMFGSDTLFELRLAFQLAELDRLGGFSPHISPFTDNVDMGDLLHQAGFNLITLNDLVHFVKEANRVNDAFRPHIDCSILSAGNQIRHR
ncbi:NADH dehydrogenase [ubiquinone] 1 alpha subcomplex assembly factor 5 [Fasciola hepatica]|uniref:Arginine-hydroxylase NDUFAF5, mitochondrial n=1 Tax=Fasciola hepatica TaxID=6192 RepID=A0A4E0RKC3_FASHE|nr:NADH dehydrogenase [ubiquinone] 1 alpha subcomplex assembly factor 5 [Fasciola hepatica]